MIPMQLSRLAEIVGGELVGPDDPRITGSVVTDARLSAPGGLFVARLGATSDGADFVPQARDRGAVAALAQRATELPTVVVPDVDRAFAQLAAAVHRQLDQLTTIAITGSSGKTTTKDLIAAVLGELAPHGATIATEKSYNGEVGVPLTVLRAGPKTRYLVTEMGARGVGHIAFLVGIAPPTISIVLNVGSAHLAEFGSAENIALAKSELVSALPADSVAILNADDPRVAAMADQTAARVLTFGESERADIRAVDIELDEWARARFTVVTQTERAPVQLLVHGDHQVSNALAVVAACLTLDFPLAEIARALGQCSQLSAGRMQVSHRPDGVSIINDAYNANPESMRAALKTLATASQSGDRRSWAVLGEMLELGSGSISEHDGIGRLAVRLNIGQLVVVGEGARAIHTGAVQEGSWGEESQFVPDPAAALQVLQAELRPGDIVLVKSSRDAGLYALAEELSATEIGGDSR